MKRETVTKALDLDLKKLNARAFDRAEWAEGVLRRYHAATRNPDAVVAQQLRTLYQWMFVPPTLWPFNVQDVLADCLAVFLSQVLRPFSTLSGEGQCLQSGSEGDSLMVGWFLNFARHLRKIYQAWFESVGVAEVITTVEGASYTQQSQSR